MPAGNDAQAAANELADSIGAGTGDADTLIQASRARYRGALGQAQMLNETGEEVDVAAVAKAVGVDEDDVLIATARGEYVVYVITDESGRTEKGAIAKESLGGSAPAPKKRSKKAKKSKAEEVVEAPASDESDADAAE